MPSPQVSVYSPASPLTHPLQMAAEMLRDLRRSRELAWRLFVRDISAQYRQSVFGYLWAFLPPLATALTFVFLSRQQLLNFSQTDIPYPAFVIIGTTLWQTFVDAINSPIKVVQAAKPMLAKINFPREALLLAGLAEVFFNFCVRSLLIVATILWFKLPVSLSILFLPLCVLALINLGMMIGILLTPIGLLYKDIASGLTMITGFWMILTPVVYPTPESGAAAWLATWNPVAPLITAARDSIFHGNIFQPQWVLIVLGTLILALFGWILYRIAMPHLIARMPN